MGLLDDFAQGVGKVGMTLAGGDPGLVNLNDQQAAALGNRSLLNFGLSMLLNSGPSYMPHSLGQAIAAGMMDAQRVPERGEAQMLEAQQAAQEMDIRRGGLQIQQLNALRQQQLLQLMLSRLQGGSAAVDSALTRLGGGTDRTAAGYPYTGLAPIIVGAESGGAVDAKNPKSSAAGPGQFIDSTWQGFLASPEGKGYTMADRSNPEAVNKAIAWNAGQNDQVFRTELNRPATEDELLASHLLGGKSVATMAANPTANLAETLTTTMGSKELAQRAIANNGTILRPDMTNAEALASSVGFYRKSRGPAGTQYAARDTGTRADVSPGPAPKPAATTATEPETGAPVTTTAAASQPATPQPGAAAPALSQQPAQQPPAPTGPAPDTPEIAAARQQAVATARARLQAIKQSGDPNAADKVAEVEKDLQANLENLNKEAREQQYKIQTEARANEQKRIEQERQSALEQQRSIELENVRAKNAANQSYETASVQRDTKQLEQYDARATAAQAMKRDVQPLALLAQQMGPANFLGDTEVGKRIRDMAVTYKLGSPEQVQQWTAQQTWDRLIGGLFNDTHVTGMGQQSDREGEWLMRQWGGTGQTPDDRLTQLAIVRKLADERIRDQMDADALFRGPGKSLKGLPEMINARTSVFDRPPAWSGDANNERDQLAYVHSHPVGEPFLAWARDAKGNLQQAWARNTVSGKTQWLTKSLGTP